MCSKSAIYQEKCIRNSFLCRELTTDFYIQDTMQADALISIYKGCTFLF